MALPEKELQHRSDGRTGAGVSAQLPRGGLGTQPQQRGAGAGQRFL